jgi:integrase
MGVPKYRKHSTRNIGFCELQKKRHYFPGKFNSLESLAGYAEFIKSIARDDDAELRITQGNDVPINILCAHFLEWAKNRYQKNGRSTGTYEHFRDSIVPPLLDMFGNTLTSQFGPISLKKLRQKFVESGLCRNETNARTTRVKRIFNWGVENEMVTESVAGSLRYVTGLIPGETAARETDPIRAVPDTVVEATQPFLPPTLDDMVQVQRLCGMRPSEICNLRWCDINQSDDVWIYTPFEHKTEHKKKRRHVAILSSARTILEKYRHRKEDEFIFSPRETVRLIAERKRASRKSKPTPSQNAKRKIAAKRKPKQGEKYNTRAYEHAIRRAAQRAGVPLWSPNQIRHAFATATDGSHDKETARILLGHSHQSTTEIYIDENIEKIKAAARKIEKGTQ